MMPKLMGFLDDIDIKQFYEHLDFIRGNYSGVERLVSVGVCGEGSPVKYAV